MLRKNRIISYLNNTIYLFLTVYLTACDIKQPPVSNQPSKPIRSTVRASDKPVRIGVLNIDSKASVDKRYRPLLDYLEQATGRPFELVVLSQESQFMAVAEGKLGFSINNPLAAVQIRRLYDTKFLATHSRPKTDTLFGGLIIVKKDSKIQTLEDLRGKKVACVDFETAAAGCIFQIYHLLKKGIDPFQNFGVFTEKQSQDSIVLAVLNNTLDAGFIRTGQLEKMVNDGLIDSIDGFRVLDAANDKFPYQHTTRLYPEWPVAALKQTEPQLIEEVQKALLNIPPTHPALTAVKIKGFVPAVDYGEIDQLIETLKLKSWDSN